MVMENIVREVYSSKVQAASLLLNQRDENDGSHIWHVERLIYMWCARVWIESFMR